MIFVVLVAQTTLFILLIINSESKLQAHLTQPLHFTDEEPYGGG